MEKQRTHQRSLEDLRLLVLEEDGGPGLSIIMNQISKQV
ncbi:hypothetical protein LEMLEM_LOCUS7299 [Lemmus lemmus]